MENDDFEYRDRRLDPFDFRAFGSFAQGDDHLQTSFKETTKERPSEV